ncbi:MAG TPA: hypothetical protein VFE28_05225 [Candidatus Krumholzibacteria bacterium]|nr:hypothetical protein [Candidatus Krumholzibacteria bacterium]
MKHSNWLFVLGLLVAAPAGAEVFMKATLADASAVLQLELQNTASMPSEVAGFDIYRLDAWRSDGGTLITQIALPRQNGRYEVVDPGIENDHLYLYTLKSVDVMRRPIAEDWGTYLSVGRALVAEATVVQGACDAYLQSCPAAFFQNGNPVRSVAPAVVGDGQYYRMYGRILGPSTAMSADMITEVDELVPMECLSTTAVAPSTWGQVKRFFH